MARGSFGARLGVRLVLVAAVGAGGLGCQALYGAKPDKLATPPRRRAPPPEVVVDVPVKEIEECQADFRGDSKRMPAPQLKLARDLTSQGVDTMATVDKTPDPMAQATKVIDAIDKFRNALIRDPYNIEATLQLALAYDRLYRKGCAIAMLKRLAAMTVHPDFQRNANVAVDSITDNATWFKRYRKDAMTAAGR
jgi:hypothetical protein